ncbi:MAG: TRAP transporter small permease subunit [Bacillota bacterium]
MKLVHPGIRIFCGALLFLIVMLSFLQIILREFFNYTFNWSDEVSQFCMTWLALFGSIWVTKKGQHLNTGIKLHQKFNERQIRLIDGALALMIAGATAVVAYQSAIFSLTAMEIQSMSLPWLKMGYVFIVLPFTMVVLCYYHLKCFFENLAFILEKGSKRK